MTSASWAGAEGSRHLGGETGVPCLDRGLYPAIPSLGLARLSEDLQAVEALWSRNVVRTMMP